MKAKILLCTFSMGMLIAVRLPAETLSASDPLYSFNLAVYRGIHETPKQLANDAASWKKGNVLSRLEKLSTKNLGTVWGESLMCSSKRKDFDICNDVEVLSASVLRHRAETVLTQHGIPWPSNPTPAPVTIEQCLADSQRWAKEKKADNRWTSGLSTAELLNLAHESLACGVVLAKHTGSLRWHAEKHRRGHLETETMVVWEASFEGQLMGRYTRLLHSNGIASKWLSEGPEPSANLQH